MTEIPTIFLCILCTLLGLAFGCLWGYTCGRSRAEDVFIRWINR